MVDTQTNRSENISHAWKELTASNMRVVWKHTLLHCVNNSEGSPSQAQAVEEITHTGRLLGFDGLDSTNVCDLPESNSQEMTDGDLNIDQQ